MEERHISNIKSKLTQDLSHHWTVEELAKMVEISVSYLYHICTLETGDAPMTWLKNLRLDKTREYLADPDCFLQVKEIGVLVGLTNMSHFAKDFKAKFGATPTNYRNQQAEIYYSKPPDGQK